MKALTNGDITTSSVSTESSLRNVDYTTMRVTNNYIHFFLFAFMSWCCTPMKILSKEHDYYNAESLSSLSKICIIIAGHKRNSHSEPSYTRKCNQFLEKRGNTYTRALCLHPRGFKSQAHVSKVWKSRFRSLVNTLACFYVGKIQHGNLVWEAQCNYFREYLVASF